MNAKPGFRELLISVGLAMFGIGVSRWTLSGAQQHDEVPVVCTLVIDACVIAWVVFACADWRAARRNRRRRPSGRGGRALGDAGECHVG